MLLNRDKLLETASIARVPTLPMVGSEEVHTFSLPIDDQDYCYKTDDVRSIFIVRIPRSFDTNGPGVR